MIKYLGSKKQLLPVLVEVVRSLSRRASVLDLFSGTSRVGHALKREGYQVFSNDHNAYAHALAVCYVQADAQRHLPQAQRLIAELNLLPGTYGYFTEHFCVQSSFFQPKNGERVDAIREAIEAKDLDPELKAILLVSLMEAADRVDSTAGMHMAYLKRWSTRSHNPLELRLPEILPAAACGPCKAFRMDALEMAAQVEADIAYLDPPYNQHKYLGNYHIWQTLVLWDKPPVYGVAHKRLDCKAQRSPFNSRRLALPSLQALVERVKAKHLILSFSDEGHVTKAQVEALLACRGKVLTLERDFRRYIGAQIGVYNPRGQKVGQATHLTNKEYIYVVSEDPPRALRRAFGGPGLPRRASSLSKASVSPSPRAPTARDRSAL